VGLAFKLEVMEIYDFYAHVQYVLKAWRLLIATSFIIIAVKILTILYVSYVFYPWWGKYLGQISSSRKD
jgi:hypothetical protein